MMIAGRSISGPLAVCFDVCELIVCLTRGASPNLESILVPQPQTLSPYSYRFRSRISIIHPGGNSVSSKSRSKPQARRAHGKVGNEVPDKGHQLAERRDEGQNHATELYRHADGPSVNTNLTIDKGSGVGDEGDRGARDVSRDSCLQGSGWMK